MVLLSMLHIFSAANESVERGAGKYGMDISMLNEVMFGNYAVSIR